MHRCAVSITLFVAGISESSACSARPARREPLPAGGLTVMSLNLAKETDASRILNDLHRMPGLDRVDVLLFQEAAHSEAARDGVAGAVARTLGMKVVFAPEAPGVYDRGLAILSRYPIHDAQVRRLEVFNMRFHNRARFALAATLDTPQGPMRVWNLHLDTRINAEQRLRQLGPVVEEASREAGPQLIGGDFNTNDFYWLGNVVPVPLLGRQGEAGRRFMAAHGFQAPLQRDRVTFARFGMHLDWIFVKGLAARGASVEEMPFSDHHAVRMVFAQ